MTASEAAIAGTSRRLDQIEPRRQPRGQRSVERIARPDRIDDVDLHGRDRPTPLAIDEQRPIRAEADEHRPVAGLGPEQPLGLGRRTAAPADERGQFALVRGQDVREFEGRALEAVGGGRIEDRRRLGEAGDPKRLVGRPGPDLVTDEHDVRRLELEPLERGPHLDRTERRVRAAGDRDRVLARLVDDDQGNAGGFVGEGQEPREIDPLLLERRPCRPPERVVTDRPDEEGPCPEPGGGHRLVAALAAVMLREPAADDGLALPGKPLGRDDEVLVDRADDDDPTRHLRTP